MKAPGFGNSFCISKNKLSRFKRTVRVEPTLQSVNWKPSVQKEKKSADK